MKLTRFAVLVLLAAAGCRFAEAQKDAAARRLGELLLAPVIAIQNVEPVIAHKSDPAEPRAAALQPAKSEGEEAAVGPKHPVTAVPQWSASAPHATPLGCPRTRFSTTVWIRTVATMTRQSGRQSETVSIQLALPDAPQCERATLSGS